MIRRIAQIFGKGGDLNPRNMRLGIWAWLIQRVSGVVLVLFVVAHVLAISQGNMAVIGPVFTMFDGLRNPFWAVSTPALIIDVLMLGVIAFHGMNGIRIVVFDLGVGLRLRTQKLIFWILVAVAAVASGFVIYYGLPFLGGS